ncbi:MAG: two-component system sensor protein [Microbacteriaceae bacterium]|nr:two-component system sensor protein [Microbacteriaceae bacterium]
MLRRLSIRWRITIGTLAIAAVLAVAAVLLFRAQVAQILSTTTTTLLQHDAAPYLVEVATDPTTVDQPGRGQLVLVVNPDGNVVESSMPLTLEGKLPQLLKLTGDAHDVTGGDDIYRVYNEPVDSPGGTWVVITARNLDSSNLSLSRITQALIVSAGLIVLSFGIASYLLTAVALRPVTRMRRQAEALVAQGSPRPLPVGPAMDELDGLALTLNEFITEVRHSVDRERQLVSDASHELRTPLAILMAQLELAHLNSGDAVALEAEITAAERSVARLSGLATGLLELSQLEQPSTEPASSSWNELAAEVATSVDRSRLLAVSGGVTIDFDVDDTPTDDRYPIAVSNFGRLLNNLTINAIAAVPEDGWVRLALRHSPVGLVLRVVDSGPGMPEDFLPVAFDRFSRPDVSRAKNSGGSGLGLAIVHAIVTSAGGTVSLANANGLSVTVTLPV